MTSAAAAPTAARPRATVRPATPADADAVVAFLEATGHWPRGAPHKPARIFTYAWEGEVPDRGYVLVDDEGRVQGYCGGIHSRRRTAAGERRVYSYSFYYVVPEYRAYSLALLAPTLRDRDVLLTSLSPAPTSQAILPRFAFHTVSTGLWLCPPVPTPRALGSAGRARVLSGADRVAPLLGPGDARVLADHRPYGGGHFLLRAGGRDCYIVTQPRALERALPGGVRPRVSEVLHVSDRAAAAPHWDRLVWSIALADRTMAVALDEMFCAPEHRPPGLRRARVRMARGPGVDGPGAADGLDALYSELVLLQA